MLTNAEASSETQVLNPRQMLHKASQQTSLRHVQIYLFLFIYTILYLFLWLFFYIYIYIYIFVFIFFFFYNVVRYIMLDCYIMYLLCSITLYYVILYHDIFLFIFFPAVLFPVSSAISSAISSANVLGNLVWAIVLVHSEVLEKSFVPWATSLSYQRKAHLLVTAHWQPMKHSCIMLHIIEEC